MEANDYKYLRDNLVKFAIGKGLLSVTAEGLYCQFYREQFYRDGKNYPIEFEAISHNYEEGLNIDLMTEFNKLGFSLEEGGNYKKYIELNSLEEVENTASEVKFIFEDIYKIAKDACYDFNIGIDVVPPKLTDPDLLGFKNLIKIKGPK